MRELTGSEVQFLREYVEGGGGVIITAGDQINLEAYQGTFDAGEEPLMSCSTVQR